MLVEVVFDGTITQVQTRQSLPPSLKLLLKGGEGLKAPVPDGNDTQQGMDSL